jgi:nitrite reductase (NADH) large subunit
VQLATMGIVDPSEDRDEIVQFYEPKRGTYKKLVIRDGRLIGAILMGNLDKAAYLMQAFDRNTPLPEERISLLFDIGAPPKAVSFNEMSDDVQICNCNGVSMGDIRCHFADGCTTVDALKKKTRAGTGCGSCKALIQDLVSFLEDRESDENLR